MRIIGGQFKGRQFNPGRKFKARPTTDMARENLFNILQNSLDLTRIKALDLFAGTGSISFELASRGCPDVTSVELSYPHYLFIKEVITKIGMPQIRPVRADAFRFVEQTRETYDLVFADPPYDLPRFHAVAPLVLQSDILRPEGRFILEHPAGKDFSACPEWRETRNYGSVCFSFFFGHNSIPISG